MIRLDLNKKEKVFKKFLTNFYFLYLISPFIFIIYFYLPTGSELSVIMTSNSPLCCFINSKPSPTFKVSFGCSSPFPMKGKYFFDTLITTSSISTWVMRSTPGCLATSRATPPSPPPTIKTLRN